MTTLCCQKIEESNGYLKIQVDSHPEGSELPELHLAVAKGEVVFAAQQPLTWQALQSQLLRYIPRLRSPQLLQTWQQAEAEVHSGMPISSVLDKLISVKAIFTHPEVTDVVRFACLDLLDSYYSSAGKVTFQADTQIIQSQPILGLPLQHLRSEVEARHAQWSRLKNSIPSMQHIIVGNRARIESLSITDSQRQHLLFITQNQRSVEQVAQVLGSDNLKMAQILEPLLKSGIAALQLDAQSTHARLEQVSFKTEKVPTQTEPVEHLPSNTALQEPEESSRPNSAQSSPNPVDKVDIFVVDDSAIMLKQFQALVTSWSYSIRTCSKATQAVEAILACNPSIIFIDINMPEISGFQLLREIRLQPELSEIPAVILTAEESYSNIKRAQWSRCDFLAKPINAEDIGSFSWDLLEILSNCEDLEVA